jgi:transglutaminase-like putative cysteine protease
MVEAVDRVSDAGWVKDFLRVRPGDEITPTHIIDMRVDGTPFHAITFGAIDKETGEGWHVTMTIAVWAAFVHAIRAYGIDHASQLILTSVHIALPNDEDIDYRRIRVTLEAIQEYAPDVEEEEEYLLSYSYYMLSVKYMTRPRVAEIASTILGRPITPEAWRKAVNKWAHENGMPKLDLPHGRPSKKNRNNS